MNQSFEEYEKGKVGRNKFNALQYHQCSTGFDLTLVYDIYKLWSLVMGEYINVMCVKSLLEKWPFLKDTFYFTLERSLTSAYTATNPSYSRNI